MTIVCIRQPSYLPNIGFFQKLIASDIFVYLDDTQYGGERWDNRNKIRSDREFMWLTVPIIRKSKTNLNQILIANNENWQKKHIRSIEIHYVKAPYFQQYWPHLKSILNKKWEKLIDLNLAVINWINSELGVKTTTRLSSDLLSNKTGSDKLLEICKKLGATTYLSGKMGKTYLDEESFKKENINVIYDNFPHPVYNQINAKFIPNLSIIDLLFNEGNDAVDIIKKSVNLASH